MKRLTVKEEYRVESELEAKQMVEEYQQRGNTEGFIVSKWSADYKTKKSKGEIIDQGYLLKITITYDGFWDV